METSAESGEGLHKVARYRHFDKSVRVRVVMRWYRQRLSAPAEKVAVVRCAHWGCYAENMITRPVLLVSEVAVNGAHFDIDDYPPPA
jgi:hypothetical protein